MSAPESMRSVAVAIPEHTAYDLLSMCYQVRDALGLKPAIRTCATCRSPLHTTEQHYA